MTGGHIHRTWSAVAGGHRVVCQSLNEHVFSDLDACEENLRRIDDQFREVVPSQGVQVPALRRTVSGHVHYRASTGVMWRVSDFAIGTVGGTIARSTAEAEQAAFAFGSYARMLQNLPGPPLHATIVGFHDLPSRVRQFEQSMAADRAGRRHGVAALVALARSLQAVVLERFASIARLPRVAVHNDAKVSNVLFDAVSGVARFVIDLDTTMPGSVLFDVGELLRTACSDAPEDAVDPSLIRVESGRVEAVVRGYIAGAGPLVDRATRRVLPLAGPLMAVENATRFLTDHLDGDVYFAVERPDHNLVRAAAQFAVAQLLIDAAEIVTVAAHP